MLEHSWLTISYWVVALITPNYLQNQSPTKSLEKSKTTYELWIGHKPNISHLKFFGCKAYALIHKDNKQKTWLTLNPIRF